MKRHLICAAVALVAVVVVIPWFFYGLYQLAGDAGFIIGGALAYVALNYLFEPYRPPWEASLFGTRGSAAIRRRRWMNPHRGGR